MQDNVPDIFGYIFGPIFLVKVTFYLLFKGLIHKAGGPNCCVRPVVSNESHSACLCIHLHVFSG